jgi:hypothetical protein
MHSEKQADPPKIRAPQSLPVKEQNRAPSGRSPAIEWIRAARRPGNRSSMTREALFPAVNGIKYLKAVEAVFRNP